jgi:hypothetical protein
MFTEPIRGARGRRRTLDRQRKQLVVNAVSRGATMTEAAIAVGVSLRTVQREAREDSHFDQELRLAHACKAHPLDLMESAARTHWRAAAWLLERTNPEQYGRRSALSCSPFQFEEAMKVVVEAALRLAPPESRSKVYACLTETSETVFKAVFPTCGPGGRRLVERLPDTPLADEQRHRRNTEPQFQRVVFEDETCRITESSLHEQPPREAPDCLAATAEEVGWVDRAEAAHREANPYPAPPLKPRALSGGRLESQGEVATLNETPGPMPEPQRSEQAAPVTPSDEPGDSCPPAESTPPPLSAPAGRRHVARGASPWTERATKSKPQRGDIVPDLPPSRIRNLPGRSLRSFVSRHAPRRLPGQRILSHLSPKTWFATKFHPGDRPLHNAPVSRDAVAERASEQTPPQPVRPAPTPKAQELRQS